MNFSLTTEYSLRILSFMATRNEEIYSAEFLYKQLNIPRRYLRRLLTDLSKAGFLLAARGRNGGFVFARDINTIYLSEIIDTMEGTPKSNRCILGFSFCVVGKPCVMHDQWIGAQEKITNVLKGTSLGILREQYDRDVRIENKI
jgi:Rrf2 family transcriptional regulator, iron-sulfur cluster assembly transcription factor